ncbi:MAG TPA: hypothetical protein VE978_15470 [Chitinophagales bacterium]|nr:hypothetical protein [Chitinophagales bacterium]
MKKIIASLVAIFIFSHIQAQMLSACCNDTICAGDSVQLTAAFDSSSAVSFLQPSDDIYTDLIDLGFSFNFFGNNYSNCVLSGNGYLSFDASLANQYSPWQITHAIPSSLNPMNAVYGPWQDLDPYVFPYGELQYSTIEGDSGKIFVFNYCQVPMYQCNDSLSTGQILIYENSNVIEVHLTEKDTCTIWNNGAAIEGIQNATGSIAYVVSGRNYPSQWAVTNDAYRFTPITNTTYTVTSIPYSPIPLVSSAFKWYNENGNYIGIGNAITVTPDSTGYYIVKSISSCSYVWDTVTIVVDSCSANGISNINQISSNSSIVILNELGVRVAAGMYADLEALKRSLPSGLYFVTMEKGNQIAVSRKIFVMR